MNNKITFQSKIMILCVTLSFFLVSIPTINVMAANTYSVDDYEKVIKQVNEHYNRNFAITDIVLFEENICNKVTLKEFEDMLTANSLQTLPKEYNISTAIPEHQYRASAIKRYYAPIKHGDWESRVNVRIETNSTPAFVRYIDAGFMWDDNATTWLFYAHTIQRESFSSSSCEVSYKGYWQIPKTGLTDLTDITYYMTYYPA